MTQSIVLTNPKAIAKLSAMLAAKDSESAKLRKFAKQKLQHRLSDK